MVEVGILGNIDIERQGIIAVERRYDIAERLAKVEITIVVAQTEHLEAIGIGNELSTLAE